MSYFSSCCVYSSYVHSLSCDSVPCLFLYCLFLFNHTATAAIYTLSLHDALPIWQSGTRTQPAQGGRFAGLFGGGRETIRQIVRRSEEHTSELQSHLNLVCRLLLEKKKKKDSIYKP